MVEKSTKRLDLFWRNKLLKAMPPLLRAREAVILSEINFAINQQLIINSSHLLQPLCQQV